MCLYYLIALFKACADGAANRLHDLSDHEDPKNTCDFIPNIITGDFDSAKPEILEFYKKKVCTIF